MKHRVSMALLTGAGVLLSVFAAEAQMTPAVREEARKLKNPVAPTAESIAAGRQTYVRFCSACHGPKGLGDGPTNPESDDNPPANLVAEKFQREHTDGELFISIRDGVPPNFAMEPWGDRVKTDDIWNVINYVRNLAKP